MDPAIQRIEPWSKPIPCPLLSINSEWFTQDDDYARLLALTRTVRGHKHVLGIAGTNHPSFADVFLITPSAVGGQTGLVTSPYEVFLKTFEAVDVFLDTEASEEEKERTLKGLGREVNAVRKPMGKSGEVFYQELASSG
jgi:platelet-activating factor acetylhydrolase